MKNVIKFPKKQPRNDLMAHFALNAITGIGTLCDLADKNDIEISGKEWCGIFNVLSHALRDGILPDNTEA